MNSFHTGFVGSMNARIGAFSWISASSIRTVTVGPGIKPGQPEDMVDCLSADALMPSRLADLRPVERICVQLPLTASEEFHLALKQNSLAHIVAIPMAECKREDRLPAAAREGVWLEVCLGTVVESG